MAKNYGAYVLLLRDGDCYGCTQPMSNQEIERHKEECLNLGYDVGVLDLVKLFNFSCGTFVSAEFSDVE